MSSPSDEDIPRTLDVPAGQREPVDEETVLPTEASGLRFTRSPNAPDTADVSAPPPNFHPTILESRASPVPGELPSDEGPARAPFPGGPVGSGTLVSEADPSDRTPRIVAKKVAPGDLPQMVGDYEILDELGRGGMGVVYRARHIKLKRIVALKMILAGSHAGRDQLARFRLEAEAIARLKHPHIVQIFEIDEEAGNPYFALEFVDGGSLDRFRGAPQPARVAAEFVSILARAMHAAHHAGVVHRDLKPGNILLAQKTDGPHPAPSNAAGVPLASFEPKITDFGLAKRIDEESEDLSRTGSLMGTPPFMAPEQADGRTRDIGPVTDVYALCAILYDMLTGRPPFKGETVWDTVEQVRTREPVPPSRLQPKVPRDLEIICLKGLRKEQRQRYGSALELAEDLRRFLDNQPILARPVGAWERAVKWVRREPARAAAAAALVLAVILGVAGTVVYSLYKAQQATMREHDAQDLQKQARAEQEQAKALADKLDRQEQARHQLDGFRTAAEQAESHNDLTEAKNQLDQAWVMMDGNPDLAANDYWPGLRATRDRVSQKYEAKRAEQREKDKLALAQKDFADRVGRFGTLRDEVQAQDVRYRMDQLPAAAAAVRSGAPKVLEALGLDVTRPLAEFADGLARFKPVAGAELAKVAADCQGVLLAWAAAEAVDVPGEDDAAKAGAHYALRLLDAALALGKAHGLPDVRTAHLRRAQCYELLGQAADADRERVAAAAITPAAAVDHFESALDHYRKAVAGNEAEELGLAEADCERVFQQEPRHLWAQNIMALCNLRRHQWEVALVRLNSCLDQKPGAPLLVMLRGVAYRGLNKLDTAKADFARAEKDAKDDVTRAQVRINRSLLWIQQKNWAEAEADLLAANKLQPNAYAVHTNLAFVYQHQADRHGDALKEMGEAIRLRPDRTELYLSRAKMYVASGKTDAARQDFEQYLKRVTKGTIKWGEAAVELAHLKLAAGEKKEALADCDAVIAVLPKLADAYRQRAEALLRAYGVNRAAEAGKALDSYTALGGKATPEILRARGLICLHTGDAAGAIDALTGALLLRKDAETLSVRGRAYLAQDSAPLALADFETALKLEPGHVEALQGKAIALAQLGRLAEAEATVQMFLRHKPAKIEQRPDQLFQGARVYSFLAVAKTDSDGSALRYRGRAVELLREAVDAYPDLPQRREFWQSKVENSRALRALRDDAAMREMAQLYGSKQ